MLATQKPVNCRLGYAQLPRQLGLRHARGFQVITQCLHGAPENIGFPSIEAIGESEADSFENERMRKIDPRSFLARALEALGERHPGKRPTQAALARIAGVAQPSAYEWSEPGRAPAHINVLKIAEHTGFCVEWLYTGRGPKRPPPPEPDPFARQWHELDEETRQQIRSYRDFLISQQRPPKRQ